MSNPLSVHWIPAHRGSLAGRSERDWFALWDPAFVKIVTDDETVPYLEDVPVTAQIVVRNYPLSELGHDRGFMRGLESVPAALPQTGAGRDRMSAGPGAFASGPLYWDPESRQTVRGLTSNPEALGAEHAATCNRIAQWCEGRGVPRARLVFEGLNEPMLWSVEPPSQVARYYRQFLISLHSFGLHGVCGNFGVGWPGNGGVKDAPVDWTPFKPMIAAMTQGDYLGLHEYWNMAGPGENWRWWAGRYEQCPYNVPILITECGIDTGVAGQPGGSWANLPGQMTERAKRYVDELAWYWQRCRADGRIQGICPFTYDRGTDTWIQFDIRNEDFLKEMIARKAEFPEPLPHAFGVTIVPEIVPSQPRPTLLATLQAGFGDQFVDLRPTLPTHPTLRYATRASGAVTGVIVHHTAGAGTVPWATIARQHVTSNGWPGIGYHFGIAPSGTVSLLNGIDVISYHAGAANADTIGICFAGNFETANPTDAALEAYEALCALLADWLRHDLRRSGHRDVSQTACPGAHLYARLFALPAEPPAAQLAELLRVAVWRGQPGAYNPDAALQRYARAQQLGAPLTGELSLTVLAGESYVLQGFALGIAFARAGDWANVKTLAW